MLTRKQQRSVIVVLLTVLLVLAFTSIVQAEWRVAPNQGAEDRPSYWVSDINGTRVEAVLNDHRVRVGWVCLGQEVRPAGNYSLRWLDDGPNPLAAICRWEEDDPVPPNPPDDPEPGLSGNSVLVSWVAPTTRTDGTPLDNLAGFRIWPTHAGVDQTPIAVDDPVATSYRIDDVAMGAWCFALTALDENGVESALSVSDCVDVQ